MALEVADLRKHVTSALEDAALQKLLDAAYEAIVQRIGAPGAATDRLGRTNGSLLALNRPATAITSVTDNGFLLNALDYLLRPGGTVLERLRTGPNPAFYWRGWVDVVYTPAVDVANRDRVAIALVELDLNYSPGLTSETIGDWSETKADNSAMNYALERESILASLTLDAVGIV